MVLDHLWLKAHKCMQVIRPALLQAGFELVLREKLEVTDDVSIIEALGEPVRVTPGAYTNIKARPFSQSYPGAFLLLKSMQEAACSSGACE